MIRKALIPAAGRGARLDRPNTPKPLVDVGGRPMLLRLLRQLQRVGVEEAVVVVGYEAGKVARAVAADPGLELRVEIVECDSWQLGQAHSLLAARSLLSGGEPFFLSMADHVFDRELVELMARAETSPEGVKVLVDTRLESIRDLGEAVKVKLGGEKVAAIGRELRGFDGVDGGLFVASPALFESLQRAADLHDEAELTDALRHMVARGLVEPVVAEGGEWADVDTPADVVHAEMWLRKKHRRGGGAEAGRERSAGVEASSEPQNDFKFFTGSASATRVVVRRGFLKDPARLGIVPEPCRSSPIFVFTDETVHELYGQRFVAGMRHLGYDVHSIVMADGEESKTLANYLYLVERVLSRGVDERSVFISLGGGVVCNVCGFVASTIYRGLRLVHLPTTLMAQCDAAISHKQAMNGPRGKNLVGSYYPPILVAVDVEALQTLDRKLISDGLAEGLKHAIGQDPGYYRMLSSYRGPIEELGFLEEVVRRNIELKCELMAKDPKEEREGMVLQYGHTVGHPIEHLSGYRLYHGEAIAIGMMVAARVSRIMGACTDELVRRHEELLGRYGLPTRIPRSIRVDDIIDALRYNKKYLVEGTRMALLTDVGKLWCVDGEHAIPVSDRVVAQAAGQCMEVIGGSSETREDERWNPSWQWSRERAAG